MNNISILDCTLRDGGYINDFNFGKKNISKIMNSLTKSNLDIIECGFLKDKEYNIDKSVFSCVTQIENFIPFDRYNSQFVAMIALGDIDVDKLKPYNGKSIDGIRLTFHKHQIKDAIKAAKRIKELGYNLFFQPVGTTSYSDIELINLIEETNKLMPYAFYIVDTLGILNKQSIIRIFELVDNNLSAEIKIGYHSHNNLQLAFSNAQALIALYGKREIILDSSVYGMGRGAGNLCTELITQFINDNVKNTYETSYYLDLIDAIVFNIFQKTPWGYNAPYYLAATHKCHPNYATYLLSKQTLTAEKMNALMSQIDKDKRDLFDKAYVEKKYLEFLKFDINDSENKKILKNKINGKSILLLGPGNSIAKNHSKIQKFINENDLYVISINNINNNISSNAIFISNIKRFDVMINELSNSDIYVTSNIKLNLENKEKIKLINYSSLLNSIFGVSDNSGLMAIKLLQSIGVKKIYLAGFDGYNYDVTDYSSHQLYYHIEKKKTLEDKNRKMIEGITKFRKNLSIEFITENNYEKI